MKKIFSLSLAIFILMYWLSWCGLLYAADIEAVLDDNAGVSAFSVKDSGSIEGAHIDSDGNVVVKGGVRLDASGVENTTSESLIVDGNVGIATTSPGSALDVKGTLRLSGSTSGYVGLAPAAAAGSTTYTLPSTDGSGGQVLSTNGSATLSWTTMSTGTIGGSGSINYISKFTAGTTLGNSLIYDDGTNVGIGTTAPAEKLEVAGNIKLSGASATYRVTNVAVPSAASDVATKGYVDGLTSGGGWTDDATNVYLTTTSDSVGIGTTAPNVKLHVVGDGSYSAAFMSGNVGIGITSPGYLLDVAGTFSADSVNINDAYTLPTADGTSGYVLKTNGSGTISWSTDTSGTAAGSDGQVQYNNGGSFGGASGLYYDDTNNRVGIGTTGPGAKLHIVDDLAGYSNFFVVEDTTDPGTGATTINLKNSVSDLLIRAYGSTAPGALAGAVGMFANTDDLVQGAGTGKKVYLFSNANWTAPEVTISAGNVGIGTTGPNNLLDLGSSLGKKLAVYQNSAGTDFYGFGISANTLELHASSTAAEDPAMVIKSSGNVGIGTTLPGSALDVKGTLRLSGSTSGYVGLAPAAVAGSTTYTLPSADGTSGYVLSTNGSGTLNWTSAASGTVTGSGTQNYVTKWNNAGGTQIGNSLIYDNGTNVGIGTTGPGAKLHLYTLAANTGLKVETDLSGGSASLELNTATDGASSIYFGDSADWDVSSIIYNHTDNFMAFTINTGERVRIDSSGNVGIGTTSPGYKLDVAGTFSADSVNVNSAYTLPTADGTAGYVLSTNGSGTVSWTSVAGGDITAVGSMTSGAAFADATADDDWLGLGASAGRIEFDDQATDEVNILDANVGIGTTNPGSPLSFGTGLGAKVALYDTGASSGYGFGIQSNLLQIYANTSSDRVGIGYGNSASFTETLTVKGGNVGIGTTGPATPLDVVGTIGSRNYATQGILRTVRGNGTLASPTAILNTDLIGQLACYGYYDTSNVTTGADILVYADGDWSSTTVHPTYMKFRTSPASGGIAEVMRITSSGNVGIGTTAPGSSLDVKGTLRLSGSTSGYVGLAPAAVAGSTTYTLPSADGTSGYVLSTNGSGTLNWTSAASGTVTGSGTQNYVTKWNNAGGTQIGNSLIYDNGTNVGIGTTSPTVVLDINGSTVASSQIRSINTLTSGSGAGAGLILVSDDGAAMASGDRLGYNLLGGSKDAIHTLVNAVGIVGYAAENWVDGSAYGSKMQFETIANGTTSRTAKMIIDGAGNVGIGTTGPTKQLTIKSNGSGGSGSGILFTDSNGDGRAYIYTSTTADGPALFDMYNGSDTLAIRLSTTSDSYFNGGNVGIGTTGPNTLLHLYSTNPTARIEDSSAFSTSEDTLGQISFAGQINTGGGINYLSSIFGGREAGASDAKKGFLSFYTDNGGSQYERMRIDSSGNVGIGTTAPGSALDVKGTLRLSGSTSGYVGLAPAAAAGSTIYTLPSADGSGGQLLSTNGSGTLSWTTAGSGTVTGSGTQNYVTKWNNAGGTQIGNSLIYDNGTNVGIGTTSPSAKLEILNTDTSSPRNIVNVQRNDGVHGPIYYLRKSRGTTSDSPAQAGDYAGRVEFQFMDSASNWQQAGFMDSIIDNATDASEAAYIRFSTVNSGTVGERLRITSAGNVGIGTTAPSGKLHIVDPAYANTALFERSGLTGDGGFASARFLSTKTSDMGDNFGTIVTFNIKDDAAVENVIGSIGAQRANGSDTTGDIIIRSYNAGVANNSALVVKYSGNVGIGTTSPLAPLQIGSVSSGANEATYHGSIYLQDQPATTAANGGIEWKTSNSGAGYGGRIAVLNDATESMQFMRRFNSAIWSTSMTLDGSNGNVGIGTTSPGAPLHIKGSVTGEQLRLDDTSDTGNPYISFYQNGTRRAFIQSNDTNDNLILSSEYGDVSFKAAATAGSDSDTEYMRIKSGGTVGIGTTNFLDYYASSINRSGKLVIEANSSNTGFSDDGALLVLRNFNTTNNNWAKLAFASKDQGDNAIAAALIAVQFTGHGSPTYWNTANMMFYISNNGAPYEAMRISSAGNVGIGTASPGAKLHIQDTSGQTQIGGSTALTVGGKASGSLVGERLELNFKSWNSSTKPAASIGLITTSVTGYEKGDLYFAVKSDTTDTYPVEAMRIQAGGNVGIGTTSPGTKLAVSGLTGTASYNLVRVDTATGNFYYDSSSKRYKDNIKPLADDFSKILKVQAKTFRDKSSGSQEIGYIAEELDAAGLKNLVVYNTKGQPDGIKYDKVAIYLLEVVRQQQEEITKLKAALMK